MLKKLRFDVTACRNSLIVYQRMLSTKREQPTPEDWRRISSESGLVTRLDFPSAQHVAGMDRTRDAWDAVFDQTRSAIKRFHAGEQPSGYASSLLFDDTWDLWHGVVWLKYDSISEREDHLDTFANLVTPNIGFFKVFRPLNEFGRERMTSVGLLVPDYDILLHPAEQYLAVHDIDDVYQRLYLAPAA